MLWTFSCLNIDFKHTKLARQDHGEGQEMSISPEAAGEEIVAGPVFHPTGQGCQFHRSVNVATRTSSKYDSGEEIDADDANFRPVFTRFCTPPCADEMRKTMTPKSGDADDDIDADDAPEGNIQWTRFCTP
eukprot:TRINITY_DN72903_c0_g1_i1.p1 TRINITY_DN72903_c0_g1~~TRINITY_DN72903_c0_g1_i1.p1  ORF type:complete len:131 (-),score=19.04 TRINITY_DN72903_c0_g1_i1:167-559(-)